jgi:hypothetical protein
MLILLRQETWGHMDAYRARWRIQPLPMTTIPTKISSPAPSRHIWSASRRHRRWFGETIARSISESFMSGSPPWRKKGRISRRTLDPVKPLRRRPRDEADDQTDEAIFLVRRKYPETNQCSNQPKAWPAMTLTARRIPMKHLILSAITAVTLLVAATTMLWSHSLFTEHQAVAMVIGQIQQIESPLQNTVEGMAKAFWFSRLCLAARAADLDIFGQGLILRDSSGWQITPEGRTFLDWLESGAASTNVPVAEASPPAPEPPPLLLVGVARRPRLTRRERLRRRSA